jgi:hypothetical protein
MDIQSALNDGYSMEEINAELARRNQSQQPAAPQPMGMGLLDRLAPPGGSQQPSGMGLDLMASMQGARTGMGLAGLPGAMIGGGLGYAGSRLMTKPEDNTLLGSAGDFAIGAGGEGVGPALGLLGRGVKQVVGNISGMGKATIDELLAGARGAIETMRGKFTPAEVVDNAKGKLREAIQAGQKEYTDVLDNLPNGPVTGVDLKQEAKVVADQINAGQGKSGFTTGTIDMKQNSANRAVKMLDTVANWEITDLASLIRLDKRLTGFYKPGAPSEVVRHELQQRVGSAIEQLLPDPTAYQGAKAAYAAMKKETDILGTGLMLRKAGISGTLNEGQTATRLKQALADNQEAKRGLLDRLSPEITSQVAGLRAQPLISEGLMGRVGATGLTAALLSGTLPSSLIPLLASSSPRAVGEMSIALGKAGRLLDQPGAREAAKGGFKGLLSGVYGN